MMAAKGKRRKRMTLAKAVAWSGLNAVQVAAVQCAAQNTWDAIGYDCLDANGGRDIPRAQVVELVLDAGHLEAYGSHGAGRATGPLSDAAVAAFVRNQPWTPERADALEAIVTAAFEYGRYGP